MKEPGDLIQDTRSNSDELLRLVYVDDCRVLMRSNHRHEQTGRRVYRSDYVDTFEDYVESGRYQPAEECDEAPSMPSKVDAEEIQWSEVDGIGSTTEEKLREAGITTDHDIATTDDNFICDVYGMSSKKLERIKNYINQ